MSKVRIPTTQEFTDMLPAIREAANKLGYTIAVHGSMIRDFDLIAVPWIDEVADPDDLAEAVLIAAGCARYRVYRDDGEPKPHGRLTYAFDWDKNNYENRGYIDLSVMPPALPELDAWDKFSELVKKRLREQSDDGYTGWDNENEVPTEGLSRDLTDDAILLERGDGDEDTCLDIAARAMMVYYREYIINDKGPDYIGK